MFGESYRASPLSAKKTDNFADTWKWHENQINEKWRLYSFPRGNFSHRDFQCNGPLQLKDSFRRSSEGLSPKVYICSSPYEALRKTFFYLTAYKNKWAVKIAIYILTWKLGGSRWEERRWQVERGWGSVSQAQEHWCLAKFSYWHYKGASYCCWGKA